MATQLYTNINFIKKTMNNMISLTDAIIYHQEYKPYIPVEYIKSTRTQYINTGVVPTNDTKIKLKVKDITTNDSLIIAATKDWNGNRFLLTYYNSAIRWYLPGEKIATASASAINEIEAYRGYFKLNDNVISDDTSSKTLTNLSNIYIFGSDKLSNKNNGFKLYYCKIYDNDTLVRDFIPVIDLCDTVCLYDKVSETFFYNAGTGDFIAGPEIVEE